jgi:hypothetical protein
MRVALESISVTDPYLRVDIAPDGTVNLAALRETEGAAPAGGETAAGEAAAEAPPEPAAPTAQPESPAPKVEVKAVALQGAVIDFSDRHIQPSYRMKFIDLAGRVTRMSSEETAGGAVTLLGSLDGYAPLEVTGNLNPFASEFFLDLKIDFRNIEMSPFTPYSSRYLGYKIEKGKLGLALAYHVLGKKLDSDNKLVLDQLTLGEAVESPDAVNLPVRFALALLTDRHGVIDLDVPVSGTLDDPEFSLGRVIWKVIVNILVKAVTSPFALLGSLFGGGEEFSYAVFDPAGDVPLPAEREKLDKLVKALAERPALKLEIKGHADPEADALALRAAALEHKLKAAKVKETVKKGQAAAAVETVTVAPEERLRFLQLVMEAEKIPRPTKESRPLTALEMEKLILAHIVITDDDLRQLASRRALAVREHIVGTGGIAPERVFLTEPKNLAPEPREGVPAHRVEFALQ